MGGARYPSSRFARKITPICTGLTPKRKASGWISGTITMMAENMSMKEPSTSSTRVSNIRKMYLEWICTSTQVQHQEDVLGMDMHVHPIGQCGGNVHDRQVVYEPPGHPDDQQHAAHHRDAFQRHARKIAA